mmetsp:Transcript_55692/g.76016  ORF Transcript_55692/g.76016 Transcript_55692/m.76016 type:complete len:737 (-) Transcript_55692:60-2270(-)
MALEGEENQQRKSESLWHRVLRQVDQNKMSRAASSVLVRSPESASSAEEPGRRLSMSSLGSPALTTGDSPASGIEVLKATFHADDGDRPSDGEVLVCCLLMAYANGASEDTTELKSWADRFFTKLLGSSPLAAVTNSDWKPGGVFVKGKNQTHPLVAQAKGWLNSQSGEVTRSVQVILVYEDLAMVSVKTIRNYQARLPVPKTMKKKKPPKPLLTKDDQRLKYILAEVACRLHAEPKLTQALGKLLSAAATANLALADDNSPYKPPPSPDKQTVKARAAVHVSKLEEAQSELEAAQSELRRIRAEQESELVKLRDEYELKEKESLKRIKSLEQNISNRKRMKKRRSLQKKKNREEKKPADRRELRASVQKLVSQLVDIKVAKEANKAAKESNKEASELEVNLDEATEKLAELCAEVEPLKEKIGDIKAFELDSGSLPTWMRLMFYELIVHGASPGNLDAYIRTIVGHVVPFLKVKLPDEKTISNVRYEVSLLVDCMSALILAKALSLEQLGHDGTDVNQIAVLAANLIAVFDDGTRDRVMLRGCFVAKGKTADLEFKSIEDAFQRLKSLLTDWASEYKRLYGEDSDSGLPDPRGVIMTKLAHGSIMSDNAPAALATSERIVNFIITEIKSVAEEGDAALLDLPEHVKKLLADAGLNAHEVVSAEKEDLLRVLAPCILTCARHTSNILIKCGIGAKTETQHNRIMNGAMVLGTCVYLCVFFGNFHKSAYIWPEARAH